MPEKFLRDGKPDLDAFTKSYNELEGAVRKKRDDVAKELEAERFKERPESADKYKLPTPEGVDQDELAKHPMTVWWRDHAFAHGLSQKDFEAGISTYVQNAAAAGADLEAERKKLGENADTRLQAVSAWANRYFKDNKFRVLQQIGTTAEGIELIEELIKMNGGPGPGSHTPDPEPELTLDQLRTMQQDPRYWQSAARDPAFVKKVDEGYAKLYPAKK